MMSLPTVPLIDTRSEPDEGSPALMAMPSPNNAAVDHKVVTAIQAIEDQAFNQVAGSWHADWHMVRTTHDARHITLVRDHTRENQHCEVIVT